MPIIASTPVAYTDETLRICQFSTEFTDPMPQRRADAVRIFDPALQLDVIGFTEAGEIWPMLERQGAKQGFRILQGPGGGGFAVHERHTVLTDGFINVVPANPGYYGVRGPHWCQVLTAAGNLAHFVEQHQLTGTILGPEASPREARNVRLAEALAAHAAMLAKGAAVAFWMTDMNVDERKDDGSDPEGPKAILRAQGLESIYDELGRRPVRTTKRKALDWMGNAVSDKRVKALDVEVLPHGNSNHAPLVGTYLVQAEKQPPVEVGPCPELASVPAPCALQEGHEGPHVAA